MNQGADSEDGMAEGDEDADAGTSDDGERGEADGASSEGWSAAAPTESDGEIPLPWTVVDADELEDELPEAFEELRFVGPATADALRDSAIDVDDIVRKRVSYRDLTEHGVHPGVAAKIRREHSLSWSFDAEEADLSRRSSQVRGLDDEERAWVAASSGWADEDAAETDGSGDATSAEAAWQSGGAGAGGDGRPTDGEAATDADDPTRDGEAAWRANARATDADESAADDEAAWRRRATESTDDDATTSATDAEAAWREQSAPTPVTVLDDVDEAHADQLADAGIRSVRRLATADPESVADALELDESRVERWCEAARARLD